MTNIVTINLGTAANTGTGDPLRDGGDKINQNFAALNSGKQETSPKLTTLANAVWAANQVQYQTGTGTISTFSTTAYGRSLVNLADGTALRNAAGAEPAITAGAATSFWSGTKAWVDFANTVRATVLTGLNTSTNSLIVAADTILVALGKLQAQLSALNTSNNGKEPTISVGTTSQYWRGDKNWRDFATDVRASVLTGLSLATGTAVTAADSVLSALGKLQGQINATTGANSNITSISGLTTALSVSQGGTGGKTAPEARTNLGLGPAAAGDWGIGKSSDTTWPDLNTVSNTSVVRFDLATLNRPDFQYGSAWCHVRSVNEQTQIAVSTNSVQMAIRHKVGGVWSAAGWQNITFEGSFGDIGKELRTASSEAQARTMLELGSAALLTATLSNDDAAAGRALRVGNHGIGGVNGTLAAGATLDSILANSIFSASDPSPPDWSSDQGLYPMGVNFYRSSIVRAQLAISYGAANSGAGVYYRQAGSGGGLTSWTRLLEASEALGIGQTWKNVNGTRALGTNYVNNTRRPIQVAAQAGPSSAINTALVVKVDNVPVYTAYAGAAGVYIGIANVIVPPGSTYRIDVTLGTASLTNWSELS